MKCKSKLRLGIRLEKALEKAKKVASKHKKVYGLYKCPQCDQYHLSAQMNCKENHVKYDAVVGEIVYYKRN